VKLPEAIVRDVVLAFRNIRNDLSFSFAALLSLCLGIGATTAIFGILNALMLKPLPVRDPASLVEIKRTDDTDVYTYSVWQQIRQQQDALEDVFAFGDEPVNIVSTDDRRSATALYVSGNYFDVLGVSTAIGRPIVKSDDVQGAPPICVLSYGLWQSYYGRSNGIIGTDISVNGHAIRVVGIAPRNFFGVMVGDSYDVILPLQAERVLNGKTAASNNLNVWWLRVVGRLREGTSVDQATARLRVLGPWIFKNSLPPDAAKNWHSTLTLEASSVGNGMSDTRRQYGTAIFLMMAMAGVVLAIVCANLANLLLARSFVRRQEIATRLALGASRSRLIQQLLTESLVLSLLGTMAGLAMSRWCTQIIVSAISPSRYPIVLDLSWNSKFAAFAITLVLVSAALFGIMPAVQAANTPVYSAMKGTEPPQSNRRWTSGRTLLLVAQVALSLVAAISAGLLVRTLLKLLDTDVGYDAKGVLIVNTSFTSSDVNEDTLAVTGNELLTAFRSTPSVLAAARLDSSTSRTMRANIEVNEGPAGLKPYFVYTMYVSTEFFGSRKTPILKGRDFTEQDLRGADSVAILSQTAANSLFQGKAAVGETFVELEGENEKSAIPETVRVIGVTKDINYRRPNDPPLAVIYRPLTQCVASCPTMGRYEIRFLGPTAPVAAQLARLAAQIDPRVTLNFKLLTDEASEMIAKNRMAAGAALSLACLSTILAVIGIYGITTYSTAQRVREIGIRMALGAQPRDIFRLILTETVKVALFGIGFGVAGGFGLGQAIGNLLYGVPPSDPITFVLASSLMVLIVIVAASRPCFKAAGTDPVYALHTN
jgi:predicted permease